MTTLTIQTDLEKKFWNVAIDGKEHRRFLNKNGSRDSGRLQAQRKLAQLIEDHLSEFPETAHRIAYLAAEFVSETDLSVSLTYPRQSDPNQTAFT